MAKHNLRAAAFPKVGEEQLAELAKCPNTKFRLVFAAGNLRSGSVKRVASAVGEGSMIVQFVHSFLAEK